MVVDGDLSLIHNDIQYCINKLHIMANRLHIMANNTGTLFFQLENNQNDLLLRYSILWAIEVISLLWLRLTNGPRKFYLFHDVLSFWKHWEALLSYSHCYASVEWFTLLTPLVSWFAPFWCSPLSEPFRPLLLNSKWDLLWILGTYSGYYSYSISIFLLFQIVITDADGFCQIQFCFFISNRLI